MQSSAPSSSNNFSAIARRLLLKRQAPESPAALFAEKTPNLRFLCGSLLGSDGSTSDTFTGQAAHSTPGRRRPLTGL
ncbi:hypothetical protein ANCCAN_07468 [Ancylostoma caninum]|uniref:Uncharacterized protein n=1 Tax=Ancylostoma caninum TaxID=29170 RepID=A0A368GU01_ANCCA|nr:hypothetical protein ANCCAN_07468 [Ancylostoma caninum]